MTRHLVNIGASMLMLCAFGACNNSATTTSASVVDTVAKDLHTQSNADSIEMKHLDLDIEVVFDMNMIRGKAVWSINNKLKAPVLRLDTYGMYVDSVLVDGNKVQHYLDSMKPHFGSRLGIPLPSDAKQVAIYYYTGQKARALQWLEPPQTLGKKHPFLYTQSESIYARSWIPCADGPGIRYTYDARVTVPKGMLALMSAENPQKVNDSGIYHFKMDIPVPAYLMALAVGDIEFRSIDERTGVYAEPAMIDKARSEFADVGKLVHTAEGLYGPYRWGRYDMLVLPPGFPIGGMENPKLTFCTPTIISGDRSLVNLISHELAHSWSGNLVTNATWNDFWLNEGFTNYFERRITEQVMGKSYVEMLWQLGYEDYEAAVADLDKRDTWLKLDLAGRDPDDGLTDIPYEKGSHFLKLIEQTVGREKFDVFLKKYFDEHAFKTITTEQFLSYLDLNLLKGDSALYKKIGVQEWVYGPGIPANCPHAQPERFRKADSLAALYGKTVKGSTMPTKDWSTYEWLEFIHKLQNAPDAKLVNQLDNDFHFSKSGNSEILFAWFILVLKSGYDHVATMPVMEHFLSTVGRRKFIEPLYKELIKRNPERAKNWYAKYRANYHPLAQESLDAMIQAVEKK